MCYSHRRTVHIPIATRHIILLYKGTCITRILRGRWRPSQIVSDTICWPPYIHIYDIFCKYIIQDSRLFMGNTLYRAIILI